MAATILAIFQKEVIEDRFMAPCSSRHEGYTHGAVPRRKKITVDRRLVQREKFLSRDTVQEHDLVAIVDLHTQADFSAYLNQPRWVLIPKYTYEHFADPDALTPEQIHSAMLEGTFLFGPGGRWVLTSRYELRHAEKTDLLPEIDQNQVTADLSYYMNPNAKLGFDWAHTGDNVGGPKVEQGQVFFKFAY